MKGKEINDIESRIFSTEKETKGKERPSMLDRVLKC